MGDASTDRARLGEATRFKPGQGGRPKGARNKFGGAFVAALHDDFEEHGAEVIERLRQKRPDLYLKTLVRVLPKRAEPQSSPLDGVSDEALAALVALAQRLAAGEALE